MSHGATLSATVLYTYEQLINIHTLNLFSVMEINLRQKTSKWKY
jgi:hypothetical protein